MLGQKRGKNSIFKGTQKESFSQPITPDMSFSSQYSTSSNVESSLLNGSTSSVDIKPPKSPESKESPRDVKARSILRLTLERCYIMRRVVMNGIPLEIQRGVENDQMEEKESLQF